MSRNTWSIGKFRRSFPKKKGIPSDCIIQCTNTNPNGIQKNMGNLNFALYPQAFILIIETPIGKSFQDELCYILLKRLPPNRIFILQATVGGKKSFFYFENGKYESMGGFQSEASIHFITCNSFFDVLASFGCSLAESDLKERIEEYYNTKDEHFFFNQAIESKVLMLMLMKIFNFALDKKNLQYVLKACRSDITLAFLGSYGRWNNDCYKQIMKIDDELPETLIKNGNFEVFEALMAYDAFKSSIDSKMRRLSSLIEEYEYFPFWELIRKFLRHPRYDIETNVAKFHQNIASGNLNEVKNFAKIHCNLKLCYGPSQKSALEHAIDNRQFEIYCYLLSKGFTTDRSGDLEMKLESLSFNEKEIIRLENLKYHITDPTGPILNKCNWFRSSEFANFHNVHEMLNKLCKIPEIFETMKLVAQTNVKITFDFVTESVKQMVPSIEEHVVGLAYFRQNQLYVGRNRGENERYGTFSHEMTHYCLYKLYDNGCLPYRKDDKHRKMIYDEVFKKTCEAFCKHEGHVDDIIKNVFLWYEKGYSQEVELIVRVNEVLAHYHDQPEKVHEIKTMFPELFKFYRDYVLRDLQIPKFHENNELNAKFGLLDEILSWPVPERSSLDFHKRQNFQIFSNIPQFTLAKIYEKLASEYQNNKVELRAKNIFIDASKIDGVNVQNELEKMRSIDRVFIKAESIKNLEFLSEIKYEFDVYLVLSASEILINSLLKNFQRLEDIYEWKNLRWDVQRKIGEIPYEFMNEKYFLENFKEDLITKEVLLTFCSRKENSLKFETEIESFHFIPRKIIKSNSEDKTEYDIDAFLDKTQDDKIVVITDKAGNGKTITLRQIERALKIKHENFFVFFITLRSHKKALVEKAEDFLDFITKDILQFDPVQKIIFTEKYNSNKVKILFDGFDEISPEYKDETFKILELHKNLDKSQIFITARTHLEKFLEDKLDSVPYTLKPLNEGENIKFLVDFWKSKIACRDEQLLHSCAQALVKKLSTVFKSKSNSEFIGLLLPLAVLADHLKDNLSNNFTKVIEEMNVYEVYKKIFDCFAHPGYKVDKNSVNNQLTAKLRFYEGFALRQFLGEDHHLFGNKFCENLLTEELEDLAHGGIISFNEKGEVFFTHETFAEFLIANFIFMTLRLLLSKESYKYLKDFVKFFSKVLWESKYMIIRMFLNDVLGQIPADDEKLKPFSSALTKIASKNLGTSLLNNIFRWQWRSINAHFTDSFLSENFIEFFLFVLHSMKINSNKVFRKIVSQNIYDGKNETGNVLSKILHSLKNDQKFETFLDEAFEAFSKDQLFILLMAQNYEGNSFFHDFTGHASNKRFSVLWTKIKEIYGTEQIEKIFDLENESGQNFIAWSLSKTVVIGEEKISTIERVIENFPKTKKEKILVLLPRALTYL